MEDQTTSDNSLYIGIDAGMFKTSVCTSEGKKFTERSVVVVSTEDSNNQEQKVVSGKDALELEDGNIKELFKGELRTEEDIDACRKFLKSILEKHDVDASRDKYAILGTPSNASREYKRKFLELANEVFSGAMLVDELFCASYKNNLPDKSIIVDIGYSKTDISIIDSEVPRENDCLRLSCAGKILILKLLSLLAKGGKIQK